MTVQMAVAWALPFILLALGTPLYLCFLAGGALIIALLGLPPELVTQVMFGSIESFTLMSIPFFLFAGELMGRGGVALRLVNWFLAIFKGVRGGLALATVAASVGFGAISCATVATVVTVGRMMYPGLRHRAGWTQANLLHRARVGLDYFTRKLGPTPAP